MNTEHLERLADKALADIVSIDYTGFHGPVGTALVTESGASSPWYETVALIGYYCESEDHTDTDRETCECVSDDTLRRATYEHLTARGLTPIRGY